MVKTSKSTSSSASHRCVITCGDKGGVGKTAFARFVLDTYRHFNVPCRAFDSDESTCDLHRFYNKVSPGVELLDFTIRGEADVMLDVLQEQTGTILIDFPARSQKGMYDFLKDLDFVAEAAKCGYRLTLCFVMSKESTCLRALDELVDVLGNSVDYVIVRNLFYGVAKHFSLYNNSQRLRPRLLNELGAAEVDLAQIFELTWDGLSEQNLPYRATAYPDNGWLKDFEPKTILRTRTKRWVEEMEQALIPAHKLLGLEQVPLEKAAAS